MIAPTGRWFWLLAIPVLACLSIVWTPDIWWIVIIIDGVLVGLGLLDFFSLPRPKRFRAQRHIDPICSLNEPHKVTLTIENRSSQTRSIEVRDDQLSGFQVKGNDFRVVVPPKSRANVHYMLTPRRRGSYELEKVYLRLKSVLGLWRRYVPLDVPSSFRVYPDIKQISRFAMYARLNRLSLLGVRRTRQVGSDNEFERLRDYTPDDNYKNIDWRATGRRRKLIVRDFQSNHSQRVVFLIDAGRMMVNEAEGVSMLDRALDAVLMLSHVALSRGDQVGVMVFAERVLRWLPIAGGPHQANRVVHAVHDIYPDLTESRYDQAFLHLNRHCRKRTLVVLITNLVDQVNAEMVGTHLEHSVGRHLPLGVFLRDNDLFESAMVPLNSPPDKIYTGLVAADIITWRAQHIVNLRHKGVLMLDVFPQDITAPLINEYLRIKARHLL